MKIVHRISKPSLLLMGVITLFSSCSSDNSTVPPPSEPSFIFSDIDLFWEVYDTQNFSSSNFQNEYVSKGTIGLKDYATQKNLAPALNSTLSSQHYIDYYDAIRSSTLDLSDAITKSEVAFDQLKEIHDDVLILNTYFIMGAATAGGRISQNGLLIAVEMFSRDETIDISNLSEWHQSVIRNKQYLPSIVVHEFIHIQQFNLRHDGTVLEASLAEGMADFLSHYLLKGEPFMNEHLHTYGDPKEEELWMEFENEMDLSTSQTEWLYTAKTTANGHPADMGYYMGYKIYESFSANYQTQEEAIQAMLTTSYREVFEASGYSDKFN
ncbi:MAG: DUF2268 domain-containing putative Zn-dependent protease [Ekhidna sp.]